MADAGATPPVEPPRSLRRQRTPLKQGCCWLLGDGALSTPVLRSRWVGRCVISWRIHSDFGMALRVICFFAPSGEEACPTRSEIARAHFRITAVNPPRGFSPVAKGEHTKAASLPCPEFAV